MPSTFGAPAKVAITEQNNKIIVQILSYDNNGALTQQVSNTLKVNLANYLSNYRMINDYVSIDVANVIDVSIDVSVVLDASQNRGNVIANVIDQVSTFFSPALREMGQNIYISDLTRLIQQQNGVISVPNISVFNKVGGEYSSSQTSQPYLDNVTKEIQQIDGTLFAEPNQIYQIRFPNKDITVRVKDFKTVSFS
jgi:hypothetical protein